MDKQLIQKLIQHAQEAKVKAYVPYSHFPVGAALLTKSGELYSGCNIENASYGLTNCAERTAVFKAVSEGKYDFEAIAIVSNTAEVCAPCGACRQVLLEFAPELKVIMAGSKGDYRLTSVKELLPGAFVPDMLGKVEN